MAAIEKIVNRPIVKTLFKYYGGKGSRRIDELFGEKKEKPTDTSPPISIQGVPKGLSQILEVLYEMEINGYSRTEATNRVAENRGTAPQTIIDKYCRQLNKRAHEIDQLLSESDYAEFKRLLKNKFVHHKDVIDVFFDTLTAEIEID